MRISDWSSDVCSSDLMSTARHHVLGTNAGQSIARYTINASGTGFSEVWNFYDSFSGFSVKDANAKSRLLPIWATHSATVNTDRTSTRLNSRHYSAYRMPASACYKTCSRWTPRHRRTEEP